jgi:hypothetical protein
MMVGRQQDAYCSMVVTSGLKDEVRTTSGCWGHPSHNTAVSAVRTPTAYFKELQWKGLLQCHLCVREGFKHSVISRHCIFCCRLKYGRIAVKDGSKETVVVPVPRSELGILLERLRKITMNSGITSYIWNDVRVI